MKFRRKTNSGSTDSPTALRKLALFLGGAFLSYNVWMEYGPPYDSFDDSIRRRTSLLDSNFGSQSLCEQIGKLPSPHQLWSDNLPNILQASRLQLDKDYALQEATATVLKQITSRLPRSIKTLPTEDLSRLTTKLEQRLSFLKNPVGAAPPPISITVLGGSVTAGVNCATGVYGISNHRCAWPIRLEQFINNMVQSTLGLESRNGAEENLVTVHTLAVGGTNTATGKAVLEFDILPEEASHPDILINAYSTNDMHVLTLNEATGSNMTIRDKVFSMSQDFIRTAMKCPNRPLLLWLDDYIGNEQREILATQELAQSIHVLANYYGFGFVSYADAVRDIVYGDTRETMFSPSGWYNDRRQGMVREIHPGSGMHMSVAWMMAYWMYSAVSTHCSVESTNRNANKLSFSQYKMPDSLKAKKINGRTMEEVFKEAALKPPLPTPVGLPPILNSDLTLDKVSQQWQKESRVPTVCSSETKRCPVSWVSGMPYQKEKAIARYFKPIVKSPLEWEIIDDSVRGGKFGWMPMASVPDPKLILTFNSQVHLAGSLRRFSLFFLKSYGEKWEGSEATVTVERKVKQGRWTPAAEIIKLSGQHNKTTSEMYTETIAINHDMRGTPAFKVRVTLTLTGGTTFKLLGIAACQ